MAINELCEIDGRKTLLIVDDEDSLLRVAVRALQSEYHILTAGSGAEALAKIAAHPESIDLVLTDYHLAFEMSGVELVRQIRLQRPDLRAAYMSGSDPSQIGAHENHFIEKPYGVESLREFVQAQLAEPYQHHL